MFQIQIVTFVFSIVPLLLLTKKLLIKHIFLSQSLSIWWKLVTFKSYIITDLPWENWTMRLLYGREVSDIPYAVFLLSF